MTSADSGDMQAAGTAHADPDALRDEIERTREQLGETVEALVAKTDVKARAQEKAAAVSGRLKDRARDVKGQVAGRADTLASGLSDAVAGVRQSVAEARENGPAAEVPKDVASSAARTGRAVWDGAPEPARQAASRAARGIRQHRTAAAAVAAGLIIGWLLVRRARR